MDNRYLQIYRVLIILYALNRVIPFFKHFTDRIRGYEY